MSKTGAEKSNVYYLLASDKEKSSKGKVNDTTTTKASPLTSGLKISTKVIERTSPAAGAVDGYVEIKTTPQTTVQTAKYVDAGLRQAKYVDLNVAKSETGNDVVATSKKTNTATDHVATAAPLGTGTIADRVKAFINLQREAGEPIPEDQYLMITERDRVEMKKSSPPPTLASVAAKSSPWAKQANQNAENQYMVISAREDLGKDDTTTRRRKLAEEKVSSPRAAKSGYEKVQPKKVDMMKIAMPGAVVNRKVKGRKIPHYMKYLLKNDRDEPELCPRILAIVLVWIIFIVGIFGYGWFHATWFNFLRCDSDKEFVYVQSKVVRAGNITERIP